MPSGGSSSNGTSGSSTGGSAGSSSAGSSSAGSNTAGSSSAGASANGGSANAGAAGTAAGGSAGKGGTGNGGASNGGTAGAAGNAGAGGSGGNAGSGGKGGAGGSAGNGGTGGNAGSGGKGGAGGTGGNAGSGGSAGAGGSGGSGGGSTCSVVTDCSAQFVCEASMCRPRGCNATNCAYDLTRFIIGTPVAASARGQVFVTWDATKLNLDFQILDKTAQNDSGNNWEDDSVEIYLDLNNAGAATYDGDDFQINVPRDAGTLVGIGPNINFASITVARTENANGYQLKVSVPWNALNGAGSQLNKTIGFDVGINDDRDGVTRETQVMLYGFDQNYLNASQFGELLLTP